MTMDWPSSVRVTGKSDVTRLGTRKLSLRGRKPCGFGALDFGHSEGEESIGWKPSADGDFRHVRFQPRRHRHPQSKVNEWKRLISSAMPVPVGNGPKVSLTTCALEIAWVAP
jgi:hypothetical protein